MIDCRQASTQDRFLGRMQVCRNTGMTALLTDSKQERVQSCHIAERQAITSSDKQDGWLSCKEAGMKSGMTDRQTDSPQDGMPARK
ncbi:hypothetical protein QW060_06050 [Myroides ceti]|uniref:Uncharacterized protein n=1 Tax=Paenimyroides ceti TaxID=395087 RepID=A0ABT8CT08_9FLAO|nr:hypothetical protein [Paenimyroides ceti]MDN3706692.1 hypothetical protein [Paenimyroides ceti]